MYRFASGKNNCHNSCPGVSPFTTPHLHDAATKDLFHLIGSRHAPQEATVRASAEFSHKLLSHQQGDSIFVPAFAIGGTDRELRGWPTWPAAVPERSTGVFAVFSQRIETQLDPRQPLRVVVEITRHTLQGVENRLFRRHPVPHILDHRMGAEP